MSNPDVSRPAKKSAVRYPSLLVLDKLRTFQVWRDYLLAFVFILAAIGLSLAFLRAWPPGR